MSLEPPDPTDPIRPDDPVPPAAAGPDAPPVAGLTRSADDRVLFGVCGGIAERYGLEPLLVRLVFVATLFLGGAGVLFYLAAALLVPAASAGATGQLRTGGPAAVAAGGALRVLVGLAVAIAAFFALGAIAVVSFGTTAFLGAWPVAVALLLVAGLLVASIRSRRTTGALLVVALALAVPATAAVVGDVEIDRTVGERSLAPGSVAFAEEGYRLGVGQMVVDLRDLPLRRGTRARIPARVDVGQLGVVLPRNRCVAWTVRTRLGAAGAYDVLNRSADGHALLGASQEHAIEIDPPRDDADRRPRVTLDLHVGVGHLGIAQTRAAIDGHGEYGPGVRGGSPTGDVVRTTACADEDRERRAG